MTYNWAAFIDQAIDDDVVLTRMSGDFGRGAEYVAGENTVRLLPADDPEAPAQLERWQLASGLSHPHLHRILRAGSADVDGMAVVYCVCERIEDRLGDLLPERALTADEARDVLPGLVSALEYLHTKGIAHRAVRVSSIVAVDGVVKLTADTLATGGSIARDMRDLGAAVVEMLTQQRTQDAANVPRSMPSPFRQIALGCLQADQNQRWDIARVREALEKGVVEEPVVTPAVALPSADPAPPQAQRRMPVVPIGIAAVALLLLGFWFLRPRDTMPEPAPVQAERQQIPALPSPVAKTPSAPEPAPPQVERARRTAPASAGQWGIVAAAYGSFEAAEKRVASLRSKMPNLDLEVFPAKGQGRKYYVLLGSGLTRSEADSRLRQARSAGAPRDAYVTKIAR